MFAQRSVRLLKALLSGQVRSSTDVRCFVLTAGLQKQGKEPVFGVVAQKDSKTDDPTSPSELHEVHINPVTPLHLIAAGWLYSDHIGSAHHGGP